MYVFTNSFQPLQYMYCKRYKIHRTVKQSFRFCEYSSTLLGKVAEPGTLNNSISGYIKIWQAPSRQKN